MGDGSFQERPSRISTLWRAAVDRLLRRPKRATRTHDYTERYRGHDYTFDTKDRGQTAHGIGRGHDLEDGDFLLLQNGEGRATRYRIVRVDYYKDPPDMWNADLVFAPRS